MKQQAIRALMILGFVALTISSAQARPPMRLVADIPFDFIVNGKTLPAGKYTIDTIGSGGRPILRVVDDEGRGRALILTRRMDAADLQEGAKLTFLRYGDRHFLYRASTSSEGRELRRPRAARERLAQGRKVEHPDLVTIVAQHR